MLADVANGVDLNTDTSVCIVGGGPVGLAMALLLDRFGIGSIVAERDPTTTELEGRRANGKGPHVPDHAGQLKSAAPGLVAGALDRSERDVGARDPEALCGETEGLGADPNRGVEDVMGRGTPLTGHER